MFMCTVCTSILNNAHHTISAGLSIFQELALDVDEEEGEAGPEEDDVASTLLHRGEVRTPVQLSNALMKALKVGGDEGAESATSQSKNQDNKRKMCMSLWVI